MSARREAATASPSLGPALAELPPTSLKELVARASLQTRVDRKYLLPVSDVRTLLTLLPPTTRVLEIDGARDFAYRSLYFDTPDLLAYRMAAYRRPRRFKLRTRVYESSGECWLEVKVRGRRGDTVKHRLPYSLSDHTTLAPGRSFVDATLTDSRVVASRGLTFAWTMTTHYRRTTLHLPETDSRVTIDLGLTWYDGERALCLPDTAVVETKTSGGICLVDRLLWRSRYRPCRMSKYTTGLAALRPHLPATPWRRTLRRYMPPGVRREVPLSEARLPGLTDAATAR
ncbi:polyphosphate polymerase domain-containing protein [Streptomyces sp. 7-21]|uniref:polyphosphate polymerase domain-containing protein n=1 Tax=Streptomyces sp. 7-21 TaxID=2802283 RepID=UPI0027DEA390|nr:polyphosphate polymerase domain-containing protein [Streptomyces sp. 7-21]